MEVARQEPYGARPFQRGLVGVLHDTYWALLLVITPLLLNPYLLWADSSAALRTIPYFRAVAAWTLLIYGVLVVLLTRRDLSLAGLVRSIPKLILPFRFLWFFVLLVLLSTFFSNLGPEAPALGSAMRADGTLMQVSWFALALVSAELARAPQFNARVMIRMLSLGSVMTAAWVLLQSVGADPFTMLSRKHFHFDLPAGAFGHSAVAEAYLAVCLIVLAGVWLGNNRLGWAQAVVAGSIAAGMAAAGGRAGALGFLASALLLAVMVLRSKRGLRALVVLAIGIGAGGLAGFLVSPHAHSKASESVAALSGNDMSLSHRLIAWRVGASVISAHPLFGIGPDSFSYVLWQYATPAEQRALLRESIGFVPASGSYTISGNAVVYSDPSSGKTVARILNWDKAHDYYLDIALATGIPSLVFFLGYLGLLLWELLRSGETLARGIGLGLLTFAVWGTAWFYTVSLDPIIWGLVGVGIGLHWNRSRLSHVGERVP